MAQELSNMIESGIKDTDKLKSIAKMLVDKKVSTTQLRKFFGTIKKIQADYENSIDEIIMLDPQLAYAVARAKTKNERDGLDFLYQELIKPISMVSKNPDLNKFENFVDLMEGIIAYHKYEEYLNSNKTFNQ